MLCAKVACQSAGELIQIPTQKVESLPGGLSGSLRRTLISLAVLEPWPQLAWEAGNVHFQRVAIYLLKVRMLLLGTRRRREKNVAMDTATRPARIQI